MQVEFQTEAIADLGLRLSGPDAPLEDCKSLEAVLLTFSNSRIFVLGGALVHHHQRPAEFWRPVIEHAFPTLNQRGQLTVDFMSRKSTLCHHRYN